MSQEDAGSNADAQRSSSGRRRSPETRTTVRFLRARAPRTRDRAGAGTIVALADANEMKWFGTNEDDVLDFVEATRTTSVNVRCPGRAHADHSSVEGCIICDAERDGTVEVLLTHAERDALACVEKSRPFDRWLAPRLVKLGLVERHDGKLALTDAGRALVATQRAQAC